jgi:cytochrome oxidase Cu insertion factor (SCO1/SenC/PrrC family)
MEHRGLITIALGLSLVSAACSQGRAPSDSSRRGAAAVGEAAPAFSLQAAEGGRVALADFAGKPVLLYFSMGPG